MLLFECQCQCDSTSVRGGVSGSMSAMLEALLVAPSEANVGPWVRMLQAAEGNTAGIGMWLQSRIYAWSINEIADRT